MSTLVWAAICAGAAADPRTGLVVIPRPAQSPGLSYFKLNARPGSVSRAGTIELHNPTHAPILVRVSAVDGTTLSTLGSGYLAPGAPPRGSTAWLTVGSSERLLAPGRTAVLPVSIAVPRAATPGEYLSGVSIEAQNQTPQRRSGHGLEIASSARYAIGVETSLPGPRTPIISFQGASIEHQPGGIVFQIHARNAGNAILQRVSGRVLITTAGHTVVSRTIAAGTFVSGSAISYPVPAFTQTPHEGTRYHVQAVLEYKGGTAHLDTGVSFGSHQAALQQLYSRTPPAAASSSTPWWKPAAIIAIAVYALLTTLLLLRHRRRSTSQPV